MLNSNDMVIWSGHGKLESTFFGLYHMVIRMGIVILRGHCIITENYFGLHHMVNWRDYRGHPNLP